MTMSVAANAATVRRRAVTGLAVLGVLALVASIAAEVGNEDPRAELAAGMLAGVALIAAASVSDRGNRLRYDLLLAGAIAFIFGVAGLSRVTPERAALLFYVPAVAGFGAAVLVSRRAAALAAAVSRERQRARIEGEERERERWARELHDDTLQELGALRMLLATATRTGDAATMRDAIRDAEAVIGHEITALRHLIAEVRPLALAEFGLTPALRSLVDRTGERTQMRISLHASIPDGTRLPSEVEGAVYRIVQEALNNAVKHSGATAVAVTVSAVDSAVRVAVTDDGIGLPASPDGRGVGLLGMRERASMLGGSLTAESARSGGVTVTATIPVR